MQTTDSGLLFQSDAQLGDDARRADKLTRTRELGEPMVLSSKVLASCIEGDSLWTAESGWQARRINLETRSTAMLYKGHKGPVTCLALGRVDSRSVLLTGSWDKTIRMWDAMSGECIFIFEGHGDFCKSLLVWDDFLLSSSSDRTLRLWQLSTRQCIKVVRDHTRPVDAMARDGDYIWTGDSMGRIKQWTLGMQFVRDVDGHETSVAGLLATEEGLWSVSMDKTARLGKMVLAHDSYVRSIAIMDELVVTGCEDEDVWVWDGDRLVSRVTGHCAGVTCLQVWKGHLISGGLDATVRFWTRQDLLHPRSMATAMTEEEERELEELLE